MDNDERYEQLKNEARLSSLITYGVDNWTFYDEACERAVEEGIDIHSDDFLSVLDECGVDNWEGYDIAGESNRAYLEYLDDKYAHGDMDTVLSKYDFDNQQPSPVKQEHTEPQPEKPKHIPDKYDARVLEILSAKVDVVDEDAFLAFMRTLKTRTWHPQDFDYAKHHVSDDVWQASEFKRQALDIYMSRLSDDDILNDWYEFERES